jgi:type II secretory pathway predicted ATPase ExeA
MTDRAITSRPPLQDQVSSADRFRAFGLDRNPFVGGGPLVLQPQQQKSLNGIRGWIDDVSGDVTRPDRLAVIVSEPGMGKSRLLREIAADVSATAPMIDPGKGGLTDAQLLRAIIDAFGGTATGRTGMDLRRDIRLALADLPDGIAPGLLIDDADFTGSRLELIRNVLRDGADLGLWIVLAGQPDLADRMTRRRSLRAMLGPVVQIDASDHSGLKDIICSRLDAATTHHRARSVIAPEALDLITTQARGNPGRVLRLAEVSLLIAARQGLDQVTTSIVRAATHQIDGTGPRIAEAGTTQAEMPLPMQLPAPLMAGEPAGRASSTTTQRSLWDREVPGDVTPD